MMAGQEDNRLFVGGLSLNVTVGRLERAFS